VAQQGIEPDFEHRAVISQGTIDFFRAEVWFEVRGNKEKLTGWRDGLSSILRLRRAGVTQATSQFRFAAGGSQSGMNGEKAGLIGVRGRTSS